MKLKYFAILGNHDVDRALDGLGYLYAGRGVDSCVTELLDSDAGDARVDRALPHGLDCLENCCRVNGVLIRALVGNSLESGVSLCLLVIDYGLNLRSRGLNVEVGIVGLDVSHSLVKSSLQLCDLSEILVVGSLVGLYTVEFLLVGDSDCAALRVSGATTVNVNRSPDSSFVRFSPSYLKARR